MVEFASIAGVKWGIKMNHDQIDIFNNKVQGLMDPVKRKELGAHFTTSNIVNKIIGPLFLDALKEELARARHDFELIMFIVKLGSIVVLDPACGAGSILAITYFEMRDLYDQAVERLGDKSQLKHLPKLSIKQFYGIEYDHSIFMFCQDVMMEAECSNSKDNLRIFHGNSARMDWSELIPDDVPFVYVIGNPPYAGSRQRNKEQREDMGIALKDIRLHRSLDYAAIWLYKAAQYVAKHNWKAAFITTNSVCQGQQAPVLWPPIFDSGVEIGFAWPEVEWESDAPGKAAVTCSIIGLRRKVRAHG